MSDVLPGDQPCLKVTLERLQHDRKEVTFTIKLPRPARAHLVQDALGLEGTPRQVPVGLLLPTDGSRNLEVDEVVDAFHNLEQTNAPPVSTCVCV